jgi:threonine dehydratase
MSDSAEAHVFVGLSTKGTGESGKHCRATSCDHGFDSAGPDARRAGARSTSATWWAGTSALAQDERVLRFVFPERPGALMKFLSLMRPGWNISLFHYRNQGADYGRILVGLQVPKADDKAFATLPASAGLPLCGRNRQPGLPHVFADLRRSSGSDPGWQVGGGDFIARLV